MHVMRYMMPFFTLWASLLLLFGGCSLKTYAPSEGKLITFKTDRLRFNDLGYIRRSDTGVEVALFSAGQPVETFTIEDNICTLKGCLSNYDFYEHYLHVNYPKETLKQIFRGEPIFQHAGLQNTSGGFKQVIHTDEYNIVYKVSPGQIYFKDAAHGVLIKIREMK